MIWILTVTGLCKLVLAAVVTTKENPCQKQPCGLEDSRATCFPDSSQPKGYKCRCSQPEFTELNGTCDRNECAVLKNICTMVGDSHAKCLNTLGAYECQCSPGYVNDNGTCTLSARSVVVDSSYGGLGLDTRIYNYGILGYLASSLLTTTVSGLIALGITYGTYHKRKARIAKRRRDRNRKIDKVKSNHYHFINGNDIESSSKIDEAEKIIEVYNYIVCDKDDNGKFFCRYS